MDGSESRSYLWKREARGAIYREELIQRSQTTRDWQKRNEILAKNASRFPRASGIVWVILTKREARGKREGKNWTKNN